MTTVLVWVVSVLFGGTVFALIIGLATIRAGSAWSVALEGPGSAQQAAGWGWAEVALAGVGRSRLGRWSGRRPGREAATRRRLELAGHRASFEVLRGIQVVTGAALAAPFAILGVVFHPALLLSPLAALASARLPEMAVARKARRRQDAIAAAVPDLVELLLATTEAGLSLPVALRRITDVLHGPLGDEVRAAVTEVELGAPWRSALDALADRTDVPSLRALVAALGRSHRLGTTLGTTLRRVVDDLRTERRLRAEEMARKAPLKMLFPLVFLVLPAFLLLTVGPVVLATLRSLR